MSTAVAGDTSELLAELRRLSARLPLPQPSWHPYVSQIAGPLHDAELHAIFLGFVFSMIFGHAPVIFPGVLGLAIPFRRLFYGHLALLHVGLALRISGDLAGSYDAARWGGLLNATAIGLFLVATIGSAAAARSSRRTIAA